MNLFRMIRDGRLSLEKFFSQLQLKATEHNVKLFHLSIDSDVFKMCTIEKFKEIGQNMLTKCKVVITNAVKRVTSNEEKEALLAKFHNDQLMGGHCGRNRLYAKLRSQYFWKGISKDVANIVKTCEKCQLNKTNIHTREEMHITQTPQRAFDVLIVDTLGPLSKSVYGNVYAVTLICDLTKHLTIIPVQNKEARTVAKAIFENFILNYSVMRNIRTDRGTEYRNAICMELAKLLNITQDFSTAYHHESVGTVERNHKVFNAYIRMFLLDSRDDWDTYAKYFQFCYNTTPNSSNGHNYTPFELVYGRKANFPMDKFDKIEPIYNTDNYVNELSFRLRQTNTKTKEILEKYKQKQKELYDRRTNPIEIDVGDKIKIKNDSGHKLEQTYTGPYTITKINDKNIECVDKNNKIIKTHKNRVAKFFE